METMTMVTGTFVVAQDISNFLDRVGMGGGWQYYWRAETKQSLWFSVGESPCVPDWTSVYFNVHPQVSKLEGHKRGGIASVDVINHLFAEFDMKDGWKQEQIDTLTPTPSIIIFSGGGWHCYWLLNETVNVTDENRESMRELQAEWVKCMGGDNSAKDLARVLRVPSSFNNKYGEPHQVVFQKADYGLEYYLSDLAGCLKEREVAGKMTGKKAQGLTVNADPDLLAKVMEALAAVKKSRADNYEEWVEVGFALHTGFDGSHAGLPLWDMWSSKSEKYQNGECAKKWTTFDAQREDKVSLKRLFEIAEMDSKGVFIKPAPKDPKPSDFMSAVHAMGYYFTQNAMNDRVYVNGTLMTDGLEALVMTKLRENGYHSKPVFRDAFLGEGEEHQFHPIKDYLTSRKWDGVDHLGNLAKYVTDKDGMFPVLIRKWFIGAVSKNLSPSPKEQNPMLVLAGRQGTGKSVIVRWIGSPLPEFYIASPIYPDNKDFVINSSSHLVWEVEELGSTIRKADIEALKAYISRTMNSFRAPYGRFEINKPVTVSFIGTINPDGNGFLNDSTGNRRYRVCNITNINWQYEKDIDINGCWAQAVALFQQGETYMLDDENEAKMRDINSKHELDDPMKPHVEKFFEFTGSDADFVSTMEILKTLKDASLIPSEVDRAYAMRVGAIMTGMGAEKETRRANGKKTRGWTKVALIGGTMNATGKAGIA